MVCVYESSKMHFPHLVWNRCQLLAKYSWAMSGLGQKENGLVIALLGSTVMVSFII